MAYDAELRMLEPYQRGKIPIVRCTDSFRQVHLIPLTNDLRNVPWINLRCQIWTFQYPTGQPFLQSGADLRGHSAFRASSIHCISTAQQYTVLIGHSMGGLVSKLQVTHSGTLLWDGAPVR
jgi:triacylglycerol esterase/lipase EstA (alpha/beta hydrolase family)